MTILAKASALDAYRDEKVVDQLNLEGSAAARAAFERCWSYLVANDAAQKREWDRLRHILKDPFKAE